MKLKDVLVTLVLVIVLIILVIILFNVKNNLDNKNNKANNESNKETITIKYDSDGGNYLTDSEIKRGNSLSLPTPTREGYKFIGWYVNNKLVDDNTKFDSNTILVAKWILIGSPYKEDKKETKNNSTKTTTTTTTTNTVTKFTVTFDTKGGSSISPMTVLCNNDPIDLPDDPTKDGYIFKGWVDKNNNSIGNGSSISCGNITLYAVWEVKKEFTITFDTRGGSSISPMTVSCAGGLVNLPNAPTREGYIFDGWVDANNNAIGGNSILSCRDITLYAKWKEIFKSDPLPVPTSTPVPQSN